MTPETDTPKRGSAPTREEARKRYKAFISAAEPEHKRVLKEAAKYYQAYGGNSIQGQDFAHLEKLWGSDPPEIAIIMSLVDTFWGACVAARKDPSFSGFDQGVVQEVVAEMVTLLVRAVRAMADSEAADGAALMDLILVGYAFVEVNLETERPPFRPREKHIALDRVFWDAGHREVNMADGQEFAVRSYFGVDEACLRFPEHEDAISALKSGGGSGNPSKDGVQMVAGTAVSVSVSGATSDDIHSSGSADTKRLREVAVDNFQYVVFESRCCWDDPKTGRQREASAQDFDEAMERMEQEAAGADRPFMKPEAHVFGQATWYRCQVLVRGITGGALVLTDPEPITGNQRLIRCATGKGEWVLEGEALKRRWFGWGRVLYGLQRLVSVAIRLELEQEARRNRGGADVEGGAFPSRAEFEQYVESRAIPGSVAEIPPGALDKIRERQDLQGSRTSSMRDTFQFLAIELPRYVLGISDLNRGTFDADRSVKLVSTMLEASTQMQMSLTSAFTSYMREGAVTMARLVLELLDPQDIDKILGATGAPPREGITGQVNSETGEIEQIMIPDPSQPPQVDPQTGAMMPATRPYTVGAWLQENVGEIMDHELAFVLRPSAATQRMAMSMLWTQHGVLEQILNAVPPEARRFVIRAFLMTSPAEGTALADLVRDLEKVWKSEEQKQAEQEKLQQEQGWMGFIQQMAAADFEKATELLKQASEVVMGPAGKTQQPGVQDGSGGAAAGGLKPPSRTINFKDLDPVAGAQLLAQAGIQVAPEAILAGRQMEQTPVLPEQSQLPPLPIGGME